ncbi:MAG TPA: hypothetical protein VGK49_11195, partial [Ilumatobacteraceae bacterium]
MIAAARRGSKPGPKMRGGTIGSEHFASRASGLSYGFGAGGVRGLVAFFAGALADFFAGLRAIFDTSWFRRPTVVGAVDAVARIATDSALDLT